MKDHGYSYKFYFDGAFEYGDGGILKLLEQIKELHQST
jgi:hypothetical protein